MVIGTARVLLPSAAPSATSRFMSTMTPRKYGPGSVPKGICTLVTAVDDALVVRPLMRRTASTVSSPAIVESCERSTPTLKGAAGRPVLRTVWLTLMVSPGAATAGPDSAVTVRSGSAANVAVHARALTMVNEPLHSGSTKPAKVDPNPGVARSVTVLFCAKPAAQSVPQLIPAGVLTTVPLPEPTRVIVSVCPG